MVPLAQGAHYVDLMFRGRPRGIAAVVLHDGNGFSLLDPGPTSTLPTLLRALDRAGLPLERLRSVLLTHIHLDHAGCVGTLVARRPDVRVFVHEQGVPHLVDPTKLVASATRLYGDAMGELWGEIAPVPPHALTALRGGEVVDTAGRRWQVAYTPGHASHHVSYFDPESRIACVGDTAGVRPFEDGYVMPPTPPPDIDLELWESSLRIIEAWRPDTLLLTHYGHVAHPAVHLAQLRDHLALVAEMARQSLSRGDDAAQAAWYLHALRREMLAHMREDEIDRYNLSARFDLNWRGLARYWRKRGQAAER